MRTVLALALLGLAAPSPPAAPAQEKPKLPDEVPPRFGLPYRPKAYPQATPKQALDSVVEAADRGEVGYLVAHLLDPAFVDARVADRGRQYEPAVEAELAKVRDFQRKNPADVPAEARLPDDPARFQARVAADARARAFAQLVRDAGAKFADDPESLKDLRRFARGGTFPDPAAPDLAAKVGLPDLKDRAVFLKKIGDRWFVENKQAEDKIEEKK